MKLLNIIILLVYLSQKSNASEVLLDIIDSLVSIAFAVGQEIPNILPTSEELSTLPPQVLYGLPQFAFFTGANTLCSIYLASETIEPRITPNSDEMSLRFYPPSCKKFSFPLNQAEQIFDSPEFDVNKKVVIFVHGWTDSSEADFVYDMANAFNCRGDYNFFALNTSNAISTVYTWSAFNTKEIGRQFALALEKLLKEVSPDKIHLIGHSLGANIVGFTGRYITEFTGMSLARITGLDPAKPCFDEGEILSGIRRGDAKFVDIIHTSPASKAIALGDVDFYPGGLEPIKPNCDYILCSHRRAYEYFTESVYPGNENNFLGVRCTTLKKVNDGFCIGSKYPMGFATPHNLTGKYFLSVNAEPPYGKNSDGKNPMPDQCKICEKE